MGLGFGIPRHAGILLDCLQKYAPNNECLTILRTKSQRGKLPGGGGNALRNCGAEALRSKVNAKSGHARPADNGLSSNQDRSRMSLALGSWGASEG
jgi:hypothetical protein